MKRIFIAALSTLLATGVLNAQEAATTTAKPAQQHHHAGKGKHGKHGKHHGGEHMGVKLSDEQKKQAAAINQNYRQQVASLKKDDNITMGAYKKKLLALQKDRKSRVSALLTPEQKTTIAQNKAKMQQKMRERSTARLEKMKQHLNLKDEQVTAIKSQQEAFRKKVSDIRANDNLLPEDKKQQIMALAKDQKEQFKSVLTKEQQDQLAKDREERQTKRK